MQRQAFVRHVFPRVLLLDGGFASMADQVCVGGGRVVLLRFATLARDVYNFVAGRHPAYRKGTIIG